MAHSMRASGPTLDTNFDRAGAISPRSYISAASPVASLLATPAVSPEPAYIAGAEAGQIITREILMEFHQADDIDLSDMHESSFSQISDSALITVNLFLDRILHNILASSRSLSLANLRVAVKDVLKPRLAAEAIRGADEELIECIGDEDEEGGIDLFEDATEAMDGSFDLDLVWKRARLRCMVYTRLGDMEEDDEERYIEEHSLDGYVDGRRMSRNTGLVSPPVAIWLTAILEFIGENALMISAHSAYRRCENRYGKGLAGQPLHPSVVTLSDSDLAKIALNPTLGRLWRAWQKPIKSPRSSVNRALSVESMRHRRMDSDVSMGHARKLSNDPLNSVREAQRNQMSLDAPEVVKTESVAEEAEPSEQDPSAEPVPVVLEPADIALPLSEYDIDEIEVPGYTPDPDFEGRQDGPVPKNMRPTSMAHFGDWNPPEDPETAPSRGLRRMRSQSLQGVRLPQSFAILHEDSIQPPATVGSTEATDFEAVDEPATDQRPISGVSEGEVFSSLKSPTDYQTPSEGTPKEVQTGTREKRRSRRNRASFVPPVDRKSTVSDASEGPVLFDRSDYKVDPNELQNNQDGLRTPHVTAPTPTMGATPVDIPVRSGLRSNRPVSLAIGSQGRLAAPQTTGTGEISPVGEGEYLDTGEVSPLEPSDDEDEDEDEGSVSIPGLKDAKEHMSLDTPEYSGPDSGPYEDAFEVQHSGPPSEDIITKRSVQPRAAPSESQTRRDAAPAVVAAAGAVVAAGAVGVLASQHKQDEPMIRQASDERRREAAIALQPRSRDSQGSQKEDLPDIPRAEQIKALAAAARAHNNVAVPQPERIYRSMSKDMTDASIATPTVLSPKTTSAIVPSAPGPAQFPVSGSSVAPPAEMPQTTRIHRKEVSLESRNQAPNLEGVTPLQLKQANTDAAAPPPTSKLLERRRQLPQVDTVTPDRASVQRLTSSPQSIDGPSKQLPPRSVPDQMYTQGPSGSREATPPTHRKSSSRKTSRSGDDIYGHKATKSRNSSNERSKEFEQLIDSGETIQYTLTPQHIRSFQGSDPTLEAAPMQASSSRDRARGLSITKNFSTNKPQSNVQSPPAPAPAPAAVVNNAPVPPVFAGIPVRRPAAATSSTFASLRANNSGLAPREAKADVSSLRDFAEFMRTTGPSGSEPAKGPARGPKPVRNADITAKPQTAGLPTGMRSPASSNSVGSRHNGIKRNGPKLVARDPQTNDDNTNDLIDFIREGPPSDGPTRVTGLARTTMGGGGDTKNGLRGQASNGYNQYADSINSTQESFKTASGISSANSHTGLLYSSRSNNAMGGVQEEPQMPTRTSRKPRDPYAIDISDEEDFDEDEDDDRADTPRGHPPREESLAEFLLSQRQTVSKPAGGVSSLGRPIGTGPGMAKPKLQARAALGHGAGGTNDLADFFKSTAPPGGVNARTSVQGGGKEKKGGLGGMFRRARG